MSSSWRHDLMPNVGSARCRLPAATRTSYPGVRRILALPPETRLFMCHDYPPATRESQAMCTVAVGAKATSTCATASPRPIGWPCARLVMPALAMPNLILPSVQVNIRAGHLPPAESTAATT